MNSETGSPPNPQTALPANYSENTPIIKDVSIFTNKLFLASFAGLAFVALLTLLFLSPIIGFFVVCLGIAGYVIFFSSNILKNFARTNGYRYLAQGFIADQTGLIFTIGYGPEYSDIVYGLYKSWPFGLFVYSYSVSEQENSRRYARTVLVIDFTAPLPAFVLRKHKLLQIFEEEGESLKSHGYTERLALEGDFEDSFQVFIKPDTQVEVLTILTPDSMELIMKLDKYEIEMTNDGKLYVYFHAIAKRKEELANTYMIIGTLIPKIQSYLDRQEAIEDKQELTS